jgi:hypothetical protein
MQDFVITNLIIPRCTIADFQFSKTQKFCSIGRTLCSIGSVSSDKVAEIMKLIDRAEPAAAISSLGILNTDSVVAIVVDPAENSIILIQNEK